VAVGPDSGLDLQVGWKAHFTAYIPDHIDHAMTMFMLSSLSSFISAVSACGNGCTITLSVSLNGMRWYSSSVIKGMNGWRRPRCPETSCTTSLRWPGHRTALSCRTVWLYQFQVPVAELMPDKP